MLATTAKGAPGRSISRILYPPKRVAIISLGSLPGTYEASNLLSLFGLAPDGGYLAAALLRTPVVSYTAVSPLRPGRDAVCFCGPIPHLSARRDFLGILLYGVRTFLDLDWQGRDHPADLGHLDLTTLFIAALANVKKPEFEGYPLKFGNLAQLW